MSKRMDWEKASRRESARASKAERVMSPLPEWWWTPAKFKGRCDNCGNGYPLGRPIAWNSRERLAWCKACVEHADIQPGMSRKMGGRRA